MRHESVIRRDNENYDIGDMRAARAHCGKSGVTRCVEKRDARAFVINRVSTDVLGNPSGLARRDPRFANRIHERGLAVIDMSHERDKRAARF